MADGRGIPIGSLESKIVIDGPRRIAFGGNNASVKNQNTAEGAPSTIRFWVGTEEQYNTLESLESDIVYLITQPSN